MAHPAGLPNMCCLSHVALSRVPRMEAWLSLPISKMDVAHSTCMCMCTREEDQECFAPMTPTWSSHSSSSIRPYSRLLSRNRESSCSFASSTMLACVRLRWSTCTCSQKPFVLACVRANPPSQHSCLCSPSAHECPAMDPLALPIPWQASHVAQLSCTLAPNGVMGIRQLACKHTPDYAEARHKPGL